jgi:hypothetical protein
MHQIPQLSGIYSWESILGSPHENQIWNVKYHINRKKKEDSKMATRERKQKTCSLK